MEKAEISQENLDSILNSQHDVEPRLQEQSETPEQEDKESDDWKTAIFRSKVKERIQEEIMRTASQVPKSGGYLEQFVFSKATSRKQYLDLVAGVVIYVAQYNSKRSQAEEIEASNEESTEVVANS